MMAGRPLLLLDVDGPLNPWAAKPCRRPDGYTTHRLRPSGWEHAKKPLRVWLSPAHGPMLLDFSAGNNVELAWATTWQDDAIYPSSKVRVANCPHCCITLTPRSDLLSLICWLSASGSDR